MHIPVLLDEAVESLDLGDGEVFLDGTLGSAGHASEVARRFGDSVTIVAIDQDRQAIERSREKLESLGAKFYIQQENFRNLDNTLREFGILAVDAILLDLGFSSDQLDESGRGFSFLREEPLDMRMSGEGVTAAEILNTFPEETLELILRGFGEERYSRRIARGIVERRTSKPFVTTFDLIDVVAENTPRLQKAFSGKHPATRTFQALRIAVNDELTALEEGLSKGFAALEAGGRLVVITFHSLEDRIVKNFFRDKAQSGEGSLVYKKPLTPSAEEQAANPRSRSAKLRAITKL